MLKIITNFGILMKKANRLGKAKTVKNPNEAEQLELKLAKLDHDAYRDLCLEADQMTI